MLLAMVTDIRVIIVKLADRLHNMRTLERSPRERQERIAQETLDIYAPIAHRLGMGKIRGELEDLAFQYLEPELCANWLREIESKRQAERGFLEQIRRDVELKLAREGIPARVEGRREARLLRLPEAQAAEDQLSTRCTICSPLRIITDSVKNCYAALGVIHNEWHPDPRPHQGLHRDSAAQSVSVAAHLRDGTRRPRLRSSDPHRRDAPHRRRRHRGALEI